MEVDLNVVEPKQHELKIVFDPQKQAVVLNFESQHFKSWDFVLGIIEMARSVAEDTRQRMMMQQVMQAQQAQRIIQQGGLR